MPIAVAQMANVRIAFIVITPKESVGRWCDPCPSDIVDQSASSVQMERSIFRPICGYLALTGWRLVHLAMGHCGIRSGRGFVTGGNGFRFDCDVPTAIEPEIQ